MNQEVCLRMIICHYVTLSLQGSCFWCFCRKSKHNEILSLNTVSTIGRQRPELLAVTRRSPGWETDDDPGNTEPPGDWKCNLIIPAAEALGDYPNNWSLHGLCVRTGCSAWWAPERERGETATVRWRESPPHAVMSFFWFTVWKQTPLIPPSCSPTVSSSSQRLCSPKPNLLEIAFNAPVPAWRWAEPCSAVLRAAQQKRRDFTLRRLRSSWWTTDLVGYFLLQDDSKAGWFVSL